MRQVLYAALFILGAAACSSIPLTSIPKVAGVRPDTAYFLQYEMAVRIPEEFRLYRDGVKFTLDITSKEETRLDPKRLELVMVRVDEPLTDFLRRQTRQGYQIIRMRVDPDANEEVEGFRAEAIRRKREYPRQNALSVGVSTSGCLREGANPFGSLRVKTYMRRDSVEDFFVLFKEQKLSFGDDTEDIGYCESGDDARPVID